MPTRSMVKRKATNESAPAGPSSKKAKLSSDEGLLSREEAADLIGQLAMELESIQVALDHTRQLLADFTARANGKRRVVVRASS
jgi:hypothetical protein